MNRIAAIFIAAIIAAPSTLLAQGFPSKPIRFVVPFPPGSGLDIMARMVGQKVSESTGQPVIVDNRAGANGLIGSEYVAKSAPDGYTLLTGTSSTHGSAPFITKNLPYDPVKDFTPITNAVMTVMGVSVHPSVPAGNIREFIDYAKKNPGKLSYSSSGTGGALHLVAEMFKASFGLDIVHVPYKGAAPALTALVAGEVNMTVNSAPDSAPTARAGKIRMLAVAETQRWAGLPDVPALAEILPGYDRPPGWYGFFGPAGLPQPVLARLNAEIVKALNAPDVRGKLETAGLAVVPGSPEQFSALLRRSLELYAQAVKIAGVKPE
jgi:tripartite-type tricarboxylate transporter receptor subunit TctC